MKRFILGIGLTGLIAFSVAGLSARRDRPPSRFQIHKIAADPQGSGDSAISPEGRRFLTALRRSGSYDIWLFELDGGRWTQLTNDEGDEFEARWSPDGRSIVYTATRNGNKDIFTKKLDGGPAVPLTNDPEDDEYPVYSPDGGTVVFTGGPWMQRRYFLVNSDGSGRRAVSDPSQAGACSFTPTGDSLICHNYDSGTGNVYLYPLTGGDRLQLTRGSYWDYKPAASPDGRWVALSRSQEGPSAIWIMPFPAGSAFPLTDSSGDDRWPTWSADGDKLLFHRLADRGVGIKVLDRRSGAITPIVDPSEEPGSASFSPNQQSVVYSARQSGREKLRIRDLRSGTIVELATEGEASFPVWSPDGKRIAFAMRRGERWEVATIEILSREVTIWTDGLGRGIRDRMSWSPDGRRIVFHASTQPFEADLYLVDTASGSVTNLTHDHHFSQSPAFAPDGKSIFFMSTRGGNWTWGFYQLELATGRYRTLSGPDYIEKNYPMVTATGDMVWSEFDPNGHEYLAIQEQSGRRLLKEAGAFARWPSLSVDGQKILFTQIDHSVEYWLAEGLGAPDSPLRLPRQSQPVNAPQKELTRILPQGERPNRSIRRASPVQLHHR